MLFPAVPPLGIRGSAGLVPRETEAEGKWKRAGKASPLPGVGFWAPAATQMSAASFLSESTGVSGSGTSTGRVRTTWHFVIRLHGPAGSQIVCIILQGPGCLHLFLKEDGLGRVGLARPRRHSGLRRRPRAPSPFLLRHVQDRPRQKAPSATQSRTPEGQTDGETVMQKNDQSRRVKTVKRYLSQGCRTCFD